MTRLIIAFVTIGILAGHFIVPEGFIEKISGNLLVAGLCVLLFFVGLDLGRAGTVVQNFKKVGVRILVFPIASIIGCLAFAAAASLILPMSAKDSMAVASGFGWYTLAPVIISDYSAELSAVAFLHNVMREMLGIILIPVVAKKLGFIEACSLPGAAAMDVCLPVLEKATNSDTAVYAFVMGLILSIAVPILVPIILAI